MQARHPARSRVGHIRPWLFGIGLSLTLTALAAPPPLPPPLPAPPLPGGAQPGGAQPVMPPPTIPIPESNLDLSVPPVYERPLGAEEGDRVFVKRFVITGVVGDRKAGINPADIQAAVDAVFASIQKIVEEQRLTKENLEKQGPEGFTPEEQDKIIKFMQGAVKTQSPDEQQKQYQAFIQELMLERLQRLQGLTIGQLQQIADTITKYYHDKGYFLARAVIPAQEIKDGVVNIRVLEGRLEKVQTAGNKAYSDKVLSLPFKEQIGNLVTIGRTEDALLTLTKYPGLSAAGVFRPGDDVGTTDILVNVQSEKPVDGSVRADNEGTEFTGRNRLVGSVDINNPTGDADLFTVTALKTFGSSTTTTNGKTTTTNPAGSSTFGDLRYERPIYDAYNRWAADISRNSFSVGSIGGVGGVSKSGALSLEHDYFRSRTSNLIGTVDLSRKRADTTNSIQNNAFFGDVVNRDDIAVLGFQLNYDNINTDTNTISTTTARLDHGIAGILGVPTSQEVVDQYLLFLRNKATRPPPSRIGPTSDAASPAFNRLTLNYQLYKNLPHTQGLLFRVSGQYSKNMLSSLEQFVMGGPDSVRAAPTSQFLVDKGVFSSLEYSVSAPGFSDKHAFSSYTWGQVLRFRLFVDAAEGSDNQPTTAPNRKYLGGHGLGLTFTIPGSMTANLQWARLNGGSRAAGAGATANPDAIKDSSQTWLDLTFNF